MWRTERMCQFLPTPKAVEVLLDFLGFPSVTHERIGVSPGVQSFEEDTGLALYTAARQPQRTSL
jgi:hypothetical protein